MSAKTHLGFTSLAACGPFDDDALINATMRVCDRGHVAIGWREFDRLDCPLCGRHGTLSGVLVEAHEAVTDELTTDGADRVREVESDLDDLQNVVCEARDDLRRVIDDNCGEEELASKLIALLEAIYDALAGAI